MTSSRKHLLKRASVNLSRIKKSSETMLSQNWRQALHTPHMYRVRTSTLHFQNKFLVFVSLLFFVVGLLYFYPSIKNDFCKAKLADTCPKYLYDKTYPLTAPVKTATGISFKIAIVSDLDHDSKDTDGKNVWNSFLMKGTLHWMPKSNVVTVSWNDELLTLSSSLALKGRGMELSELVVFDGKLLSFDDRTGTVYHVEDKAVYPWVILNDGNGKNSKGFKAEWATIKDKQLYIGSIGKEWTTDVGEFENNNPMWIKVLSPNGAVRSLNWIENYKRLRETLGIHFPGYMIHESAVWSDIHKHWFFLPRRCSKEQYNDKSDELMSCNVLLVADEYFVDVKATTIGNLVKVRGFSSFKFLPGSQDSIIIALKSEEFQGQTATYITAFTVNGEILMPDLKVIDKKFEGLEFV